MWHSHPSSASWRIVRMRARSEPPPSPTGCTERKRLVRVAVNAEQLLYRSPGGIGRDTAQLLTALPRLFPEADVVPFAAAHSDRRVTGTTPPSGKSLGST